MLHVNGTSVYQTGSGQDKAWTIQALFEAHDPLGGEPPAEKNRLFRQILPVAAEQYADFSETARLRFDFWKNLDPGRIESQAFQYTTKVSDTCHWSLEITPDGLIYRDISGCYGPHNKTHTQLFCDFWFYGPLMPMPDLRLRKALIAELRRAFIRNGAFAEAHFKLFEYPVFHTPPVWENGDYQASDFVIMRDYGVEYGRQNFHDGLVFLEFVSFEHCLGRRDLENPILTRDILRQINARTQGGEQVEAVQEAPGPPEQEAPAAAPPFGPAQAVDILMEGVFQAPERERQSIALTLWRDYKSDKSVEVLLSLLGLPDTYWRDFVFSTLGRMQESRAAREWIWQCLQGNRETYFSKAVDVLRLWALEGNAGLADPAVLRTLTWQNKMQAAAGFSSALEQVKAAIFSHSA